MSLKRRVASGVMIEREEAYAARAVLARRGRAARERTTLETPCTRRATGSRRQGVTFIRLCGSLRSVL